MKIAARSAFFSLSKGFLEELVKNKAKDIDLSKHIFDIIYQLVITYLAVTPEEALVICRQRLAAPLLDDQPELDALLEVDEAVAVLDKYDVPKVHDAQKAAESRRADRASFKEAYGSKARAVFQPHGATKKGAKKAVSHFVGSYGGR